MEAPVDLLDQAFLYLGPVAHAVDGGELPELLVEVDDRYGLRGVDLEPVGDRVGGVVVALHDVAAAHVARPVDVGAFGEVVGGAAIHACAAAGDAVEDVLRWHLDVEHEVERMVDEDLLELLRLHERAREAVEDEAVLERPAGGEVLVDDADDDLVGDELTGVEVRLHLETGGRALRHRGAEDVTGRQVLDAVVRRQQRRLCSLTSARLAEQDEAYPGSVHVRTGSLRSSASSTGCRSASSSRARHRR